MAITPIAEAVGWIARAAYETLHRSQQERIDAQWNDALHDANAFKTALLRRDRVALQLLLDGLLFGVPASLTPREFEQLRAMDISTTLDAYDLLGLYGRARAATFARNVIDILQTSDES